MNQSLKLYQALCGIEFYFLCISSLPPHFRISIPESLDFMKTEVLKAAKMSSNGMDAVLVNKCLNKAFSNVKSLLCTTDAAERLVASDPARYTLQDRENALALHWEVEKLVMNHRAVMPEEAITWIAPVRKAC